MSLAPVYTNGSQMLTAANVGIGTTNPLAKLHIYKGTTSGDLIRIDDVSSGADTTPFVVTMDGRVGISQQYPVCGTEIWWPKNAASNAGMSNYALGIYQFNPLGASETNSTAAGIAFGRQDYSSSGNAHVSGKILFISDGTGYGRGDFSIQLKNVGVNGDNTTEVMRLKKMDSLESA